MRPIWLGACVAAGLLAAGTAMAQTTVKWLHIESNPRQVQEWERIARAFEAERPGVTVQMQYLENEAFKAKLPTLLQSPDRPHVIYSWGGGVYHAQIAAGVLEDITDRVKGKWADAMLPATIQAFTHQGRMYGAPMLMSQVVFWYNKALFAKAGVDATAIGTWDDLLAAVAKLKAAGITPIAVGGADKWPVHFYWTHLAIRLGGKETFEAALAGKGDGFASETFVRSGELLKQLSDTKPFQPGFLAATAPQTYGLFGDGKAAMILMGNWMYNGQKVNSVSKQGLADDEMGMFAFPMVPGGKGQPTDTLGGINGWLITKGAPAEAVDFLELFLSPENQRVLASQAFFIPVAKGADADMTNPFFKQVVQNIAASGYHQLFYDQMLGPDVGRVVNDVATEIAGGSLSPQEAAQQVQEAWAQAKR